jgi:ABC-type phosphate/phosphonate transport system substrate-binding protein
MTWIRDFVFLRPVRNRRRNLGWVAGLALGLAAGCLAAPVGVPPSNVVRAHIGISPGSWQGLNRNDASAAIATWAKTILRQRGTTLEVKIELFDSDEALAAALRRKEIDAVSMLPGQFVAVEREIQPDAVFATVKNGSVTERYVLLVHRRSGIGDLAGLRGRKLMMQSNSRTSLVVPWIETLLAGQSPAEVDRFFGSVIKSESPSKTVLQVFFRQADAGIVTANALAVASELNPQLQRELQVLATSPEVVPALFFFRPSFDQATRAQMEDAMRELGETPAGRQVMTVFQGDGMTKLPLSALRSTRELLAQHARRQPSSAPGVEPSGPAGQGTP